MEEKPRYSRVSDMIELILLMQSRYSGVSLSDIEEYFHVSRRTAERMRDSLLNIMPQVKELEPKGKVKYWGFRNYSLNTLVNFSAEEISVLEKIKNHGDEVTKIDLEKIIAKLKALNNQKIESVENEIEFLMRSEGFAVRQVPNYKVDLTTISIIRQAIKDKLKISATYNDKPKTLSPLGLIYGEKVYLVAIEEDKGTSPYCYFLHKLKEVKVLKDKFDIGNFDIKEFANRSFGVYQGESYGVKLRFSPEIKEEVLNYNFHPTQKVRVNKDNSVTVTFKASGEYEIIWHLFKWGNNVQIIEPKELKKSYRGYLEKVLKGI